MATKVAYEEPAERVSANDIVLQIEGLIPSHDGTFTLRGVKELHVDFPTIDLTLQQAGMEREDSEELTEKFARMIFQHQLTKVLAQRTKRVG